MRIAVIGTARHPIAEPYAGGQERFTADLVRGLRGRGHHVELWARAGTDASLADLLHELAETPDLSTIASGDPNMPEPEFLRDQVAFLGVVRDLLGRSDIDVVVNQSLHQLPLAASSAMRTPMITTLHTPPFPWMEIGAWLAGEAAHLVAVSAALRRQWETLPSVRVIHNGVDCNRFPVGLGGDTLAWVGRLTPEKGADLAVRAAAASGIPLRLAGPIGDAEWFDHTIRPMLGRCAEYIGALTDMELAALYGDSVATLVTPRWEEPFCLVAAESQMAGTPVAGLRRGGLPEVVTPPGGLLVHPGRGEVDRLADAIGTVARTDRSAIGRHARERLGNDATVQAYEELLMSVCAGSFSAFQRR